mmetsp:Transcript_114644/g.324727  ORF Transcript_114644/g.324727 Transcript_114644/m.324727 type:complete len:473 (+) Transcript_114644:65-1483(+)
MTRDCSASQGDGITAVAHIFKRFDSRGDGMFSCLELASVLRALDNASVLTDTDIDDLLRAIDTDAEGWIHYEAFCRRIFSGGDGHPQHILAKSHAAGLAWDPRATSRRPLDLRAATSGSDLSFSGELPLPGLGPVSPAVGVGGGSLHSYASQGSLSTTVENRTLSKPPASFVAMEECEGAVSPFTWPPWGARAAGSGGAVALVSLASDANEQCRPYMEDGHKVVDPFMVPGSGEGEQWGFYAVYDGHGGRQEVDYCEATLHEVVLAELQGLSSGRDVGCALKAAFEKIDGQLAMLGAWKSGCTATVALVHRKGPATTLHVANVGDSRAVVLGRRSVRRVSNDHRATDPSEAARIAQEGGMVRHGRVGGQLSVSRSLGDHHLKSCGVSCIPEVHTCDVLEDRALVIASDGLWDALGDEDAYDVIDRCVGRAAAQVEGPEAIAEHLRGRVARDLVECAKERGSRDNILALVVFF